MKPRNAVTIFVIFCLHHVTLAQNQAALDDLYRQASVREQVKDVPGAVRIYDQAARQGHTPSMVRLGYLRQEGIGGAPDLAGAMALFDQAAKAGNLDGQFMLAISYAQGVGVPKDPAAARRLLLHPAAAGHQFAQFALGVMLNAGEGGPKKETAARRWMDKATTGPDRTIAAQAASMRDQIDKRILAPDNSAGVFLGLIFFMALAGAALGGGNGGGGVGSVGSGVSSGPFGGGGSSAAPSKPCHPVPQGWFDSSTPNGSKLWHPSPQSSMVCQ